LLLVQTGEFTPVAVAIAQAAIGIALPDHLWAEVDQRAVALLHFPGEALLQARFGQIAEDFDEALRLAVVQKRGKHSTGPEAGTVLALVPALIDGAAFLSRRAHFLLRGVLYAILFGEDAGERLANHLFGSPAEHALRTAVPAGDAPAWVAGENGVVLGAVDDLAAARVFAA